MNSFYDLILRELNAGKSSEEIAKALSSDMNKAEKALETQKKKEEEARKAAAEKRLDVRKIYDTIAAYYKKYHDVDFVPFEIDRFAKILDNVKISKDGKACKFSFTGKDFDDFAIMRFLSDLF